MTKKRKTAVVRNPKHETLTIVGPNRDLARDDRFLEVVTRGGRDVAVSYLDLTEQEIAAKVAYWADFGAEYFGPEPVGL